ncbi:LOW QUALITY PROTEIN: zinc finger protein RFP-like [Chelonoidis abingdonii]|uniref:LOW QUALITY PROTEIN: zinc finger protein RFP-like n=1 Tax=Chelonoidis abingdonii TaxID=106734 RepID=UPI003F496D66
MSRLSGVFHRTCHSGVWAQFLRACIFQCWEGSYTAASCPQCRETVQQRNLRPNRQLANMVEITKQLSLQAAKGAGGDGVCGEHQEALKLFCEEDQTSICLICRESQAHRAHTVVPIQEAAQEYKEKIQAQWETLREEIEKVPGFAETIEGKHQEYLLFPCFHKQTQTERQKIVSEFQQLRQFLDEQEQLLLAQLEKLDEDIVRIHDENVNKLSKQISHFCVQISATKEKCRKPASEFLQDIRSTLSRCEKRKFQEPEVISSELEERVSGFSQKIIALLEALSKFKDTLPSELERKRGQPVGAHRQVNVTLDPDTAHPQLVLSENQKSVRWGDTQQRLPDNPERFDYDPCVLGCEGFTSGRHCWEVEVGDGGCWAVGVARESVGRKGQISCSPERGIWAVEWLGQFQALTSPVTPLCLNQAPSRIQVCLDCDQGQVTFIDAGDEAPIFTFPPGSIPGERIRPWLWVGGSRLRLCP